MSRPPTVSAIMPVYDGAATVGKAIDAVLGQTLPDWELIVVDDGSTDETAVVLDRYRDPRIRIVRLARNRGRAAARNLALRVATGRYIAPCDADDVSLPERFAREVAYLDAHPDIDVVSGQVKYFWGATPPTARLLYPETPEGIRQRFARGWMGISHAACLIRAECFAKLGTYRESFARSEDFELFLRWSRCCRFRTLPEFLLLYRHEVRGVAVRKWVDTMRYHRYALYLDRARPDAAIGIEAFSRRWRTRGALYGADVLRLARYVVRSYLPRPRTLR